MRLDSNNDVSGKLVVSRKLVISSLGKNLCLLFSASKIYVVIAPSFYVSPWKVQRVLKVMRLSLTRVAYPAVAHAWTVLRHKSRSLSMPDLGLPPQINLDSGGGFFPIEFRRSSSPTSWSRQSRPSLRG